MCGVWRERGTEKGGREGGRREGRKGRKEVRGEGKWCIRSKHKVANAFVMYEQSTNHISLIK